jgi:hypothetical protein
MAVMFVGFLVVGLGRDRPAHHASRLIFLIVIVSIGYEAAKIHAI